MNLFCSKGDRFALSSALFLLILISGYELSTLKSMYDVEGTSAGFLILLTIGLFILFNVIANMFYMILTDTSIFSLNKKLLPVVILKGWRYCSTCEVNCPPRSFHCHMCNKCILKRFNHCTFLGKCCGYLNARYYFLFVIYTWLGTIYCNFLNAEYIYEMMHGFSLKTVFVTLMPLFAWILGLVDNIRLITVFVNTTCLISFLILFFYLILNLKLIKTGQTWFEKANSIYFNNSKSLKTNIIETFGSNWYFTIFCPFIKHQLPGDGTHFEINESLKNI